MSLAMRVVAIFNRANRRYGYPTVTTVAPIADWTLPAGFAYDDDEDVISNAAGLVITNPEDYWTSETIYIVPVRRSGDLQALIAAGEIPGGQAEFYILADDVPTVRTAFAIYMGGSWYDVQEIPHGPVGLGPDGLWARVRVSRRS